jgi:hypothetical protein
VIDPPAARHVCTVPRAVLSYPPTARGPTKAGSSDEFFSHTQLFDPGLSQRVRLTCAGTGRPGKGLADVDYGGARIGARLRVRDLLRGVPMILLARPTSTSRPLGRITY